MRDPYEVLGLQRDADQGQIRAAYRRLSSEFHPDRNRDYSAHEKMAEINRAYAILSDPTRKAQFDDRGSTAQAKTHVEMAHDILRQITSEVLKAHLGDDSLDLLDTVNTVLWQNVDKVRGELSTNKKRRKQLARLVKAATDKSAEHPLLGVYDGVRKHLHAQRVSLIDTMRAMHKADKLLETDYVFDWEEEEEVVEEVQSLPRGFIWTSPFR